MVSYQKVKEVKEMRNTEAVNELLTQGWILLDVFPKAEEAWYVLARTED